MSKNHNSLFKKVLIANRGEVACRIIRTARALGIETLAVYSTIDSNSPHVYAADHAIHLGDDPALLSYANVEKLLDVAQSQSADCIHPGYGFLSEDPLFAEACLSANLKWIGPSPQALRIWGDKAQAKLHADSNNVTTLASCILDVDSSTQRYNQINTLGLPCLLKPTQGGGGIGMQVIHKQLNIEEYYQQVNRYCTAWDARVMAEHFLEHPRHIEVQVAVDCSGAAIHLFERECSIQRRYQKIIEEAPAACLNTQQRQTCYELALRVINSYPYVGLATVEFLFDGESFYFLEVNPRLQVEHTVTEMVTGLDLVALQFQLAAGKYLKDIVPAIELQGTAIQTRICAEDPSSQFTPVQGYIRKVSLPASITTNIRVDSGIAAGHEVGLHYDSLLAKLIVHADSRTEAITTLQKALRACQIDGIDHNLMFLQRLVTHQDWCINHIDRDFISTHLEELIPRWPSTLWQIWVFAAAYRLHHLINTSDLSPTFMGWQHYSESKIHLTLWYRHQSQQISLNRHQQGWMISFDGQHACFKIIDIQNERLELSLNEVQQSMTFESRVNGVTLFDSNHVYPILWDPGTECTQASSPEDCNQIKAPIPGFITALNVEIGQIVTPKANLLIIEAMKLQHQIRVHSNKRVTAIYCNKGDQVDKDALLIQLEECPVD